MTKKSAKPEATDVVADENTSGTGNPAIAPTSATAPLATTAAGDGGNGVDGTDSDDSTTETASTDITRPQPQHTGAGAMDKPQALYVVGACPVLHDHEVYQPGDELELTAAEAARLKDKVEATKA